MSRSRTTAAAKTQHQWLFGRAGIERDFQKDPPVAIRPTGYQSVDRGDGALKECALDLRTTRLLSSSVSRIGY
jgi:hypothetical protein